MILGWGGIPVLWMGDELALRNDRCWADEPGHEADNRWVHRGRMPWDVAGRRLVPGTIEQRVFDGLADRARVRASLPHLHASVATEPLDATDAGVFAVVRRHPIGPLLALTTSRRPPAWCRPAASSSRPRSRGDPRRVTARRLTVDADDRLELARTAGWLVTGRAA